MKKKYLTTNYLIFLKKIRGVENATKKALPLQLQGSSPSNMDQYSLEQLFTKFGAFITLYYTSLDFR